VIEYGYINKREISSLAPPIPIPHLSFSFSFYNTTIYIYIYECVVTETLNEEYILDIYTYVDSTPYIHTLSLL
jgi:hypothetical protein